MDKKQNIVKMVGINIIRIHIRAPYSKFNDTWIDFDFITLASVSKLNSLITQHSTHVEIEQLYILFHFIFLTIYCNAIK